MSLTSEQKLEKKRIYYHKNKAVILEKNKRYYLLHREDISERRKVYHREYYKKNREKILERTTKYGKEHKEDAARWARIRRQDPESRRRTIQNEKKYRYRMSKESSTYKINYNISRAIRTALRGTKNGRSWQGLVGCSLQELRDHLERMFSNGMSWENYGSYWHIDHIIPKSLFFYDSPEDEEFLLCWNYTNLKPMMALENIKKGNKFIG